MDRPPRDGLGKLIDKLTGALRGEFGDSNGAIPAMDEDLARLSEALSAKFPNPKVFDEGHILTGVALPCPAHKDHDHIVMRLNDQFIEDPSFPETSNEDVEVFNSHKELKAFLEKADPEEMMRYAQDSSQDMVAPGMMALTGRIAITQLPNGKYMLVKNRDKAQDIDEAMDGTPKLTTQISHNYSSADAFHWIDRATVMIASRYGYKGQTLRLADNGKMDFAVENTGYSYASWRQLVTDAVNTQKFGQIISNGSDAPLNVVDAIEAIHGLHTVGFSIGKPNLNIAQDQNGHFTIEMRHALTDMELEIRAEDIEEANATFSAVYKNSEGKTIEINDRPLNSTTFLSDIVRPMTEQMQRDYPEVVRVGHFLEIAKQSKPAGRTNKFEELRQLTARPDKSDAPTQESHI